MKRINFLASVLFVIAGSVAVCAQIPPPGASDKNLEDRNIKNRSNELERVKREANKPNRKNQKQTEKAPESNFEEIKKDFEQIQLSQDAVIAAYMHGKEIDYAKMAASAEQINKSATRLLGNLFSADDEKKKDAKADGQAGEASLPGEVKDLIVDLDNTLAAFVANPMFTNPQVVSAADNKKAQEDLERVIRLSAALRIEAGKQANGKN